MCPVMQVNMILLKTLRLYTPGVVLNRAIFEDIKLGEMSLPAGIMPNHTSHPIAS